MLCAKVCGAEYVYGLDTAVLTPLAVCHPAPSANPDNCNAIPERPCLPQRANGPDVSDVTLTPTLDSFEVDLWGKRVRCRSMHASRWDSDQLRTQYPACTEIPHTMSMRANAGQL